MDRADGYTLLTKTRRILKRLALIFTALIVVASVVLWIQTQRLESRAVALAEAGRNAITLLNELAGLLKEGRVEAAVDLYAEDFSGSATSLWQETFRENVDDILFYDWRQVEVVSGIADREAALAVWRNLLQDLPTVEMVKLKLDSVEEHSDSALRIRSFFWLRAYDETGRTRESQARLRLWLVKKADGWRITNQALIHGETVAGERTGFTEVAAEAGIDFAARFNPMFETPEWRPSRFEIFKYASAGVSAADVDGDGFEDLFFADGLRSALYRNLGDGTFRDITTEVGLPDPLTGFNVGLFSDFDNDGDKDLFLGGWTVTSRVFKNLDGHKFEEVTDKVGVIPPLVTTAAAADYDNDGDLDLYIGRYLDPRVDLPTTLFYTRNSAGNTLLRNDGDLGFTDVTEKAGVREGGLTLGVAWGDIDLDGDQDLYVANDFGRNALFRNQGDGTFADITAESGTLDFGFGMSASFGDVDNDGDLDLYVSNVHSGQRWYGQAATLHQYLLNSIRQGTFGEDFPLYQEIFLNAKNWQDYGDQMVKGNSLFINDGRGRFTDVSEKANANPYGWYWGSTFFDYDNDGYTDIFAANGWITGKEYDDL